jgi:hypothetical protein
MAVFKPNQNHKNKSVVDWKQPKEVLSNSNLFKIEKDVELPERKTSNHGYISPKELSLASKITEALEIGDSFLVPREGYLGRKHTNLAGQHALRIGIKIVHRAIDHKYSRIWRIA